MSDRGESDEESEDNVSIVSRTPSPPPSDVMDIDKYDGYIHHIPREIITVETKIKSTNKGFAMLAKLGWSEGQPLGLSGDGRVDPIPFQIKSDLTGLGKTNQDFRMIETTVAQRRVLDSERQRKETVDQRKAREDTVAWRAAVKSEITDTLRPFYCTLCEKQFQNVAQYDEHTNSYAHHHRARLRDMQANARPVLQEDVEKRKEKERKREEKELRKLAKAVGIKIAKPSATAPAVPVLTPVVTADITANANEPKLGGSKKAGWASISTRMESVETGVRRAGSSAIDSGTPSSSCPPSPPPPTDPGPLPPPPLPSHPPNAPSFRAGGWSMLDTGSTKPFPPEPSTPPALPPPLPSIPVPPPPPSNDQHPPPPPQSLQSSPGFARGGWAPVSSQQVRDLPLPQPLQSSTSSSPLVPASHPLLPPPPATPPPQETKLGWQQWKQSKNFRRK
ncbi:hypothetical protein V8B97DRAFT_1975067 [Scleroderma yunnanense]